MKPIHSAFNPNYSKDAPTIDEVYELTDDAILEFGVPWCGHYLAAESACT